jgi:hypothetical protein
LFISAVIFAEKLEIFNLIGFHDFLWGNFMPTFKAISLTLFIDLFLSFSLQNRNFLFLLPIYKLNVLQISKFNHDWTDSDFFAP